MVPLHPSASPPDKYISSLRQWYFGLDLERRALRQSQTIVKYVANVIVFGKTKETLNVSHPVTCDRRDQIVERSEHVFSVPISHFTFLNLPFNSTLATSTFVRISTAMQKSHMLPSKLRCISIELDLFT